MNKNTKIAVALVDAVFATAKLQMAVVDRIDLGVRCARIIQLAAPNLFEENPNFPVEYAEGIKAMINEALGHSHAMYRRMARQDSIKAAREVYEEEKARYMEWAATRGADLVAEVMHIKSVAKYTHAQAEAMGEVH